MAAPAPNTKTVDDPGTDPSSGGKTGGQDPKVNPGSDGKGDPPGDPPNSSTLNQLVQQQVQGEMDRSQELMKQGRFQEMNPKVIQLLAAYDKLTAPAAPSGTTPPSTAEPSGLFGDPTPAADPTRKNYEDLGKESEKRRIHDGITSEITGNVVGRIWASEAKALLAELGETKITPESYAAIDFMDRKRFPMTEAGHETWQAAVMEWRKEQYGSKSAEEEENADTTGINADRVKAQGTRRKPDVTGSSPMTQDLLKAARSFREGKMKREDYLEKVRGATSNFLK